MYIYIYREREMYTHVYMNIYMYTHVYAHVYMVCMQRVASIIWPFVFYDLCAVSFLELGLSTMSFERFRVSQTPVVGLCCLVEICREVATANILWPLDLVTPLQSPRRSTCHPSRRLRSMPRQDHGRHLSWRSSAACLTRAPPYMCTNTCAHSL